MDGDVFVTIPVSPAAAELLRDESRARAMGELVSQLLHDLQAEDPLVAAIASLKAEAHANGLTDEIIDAELAAYNAEHRL
jgi:hypothetical protein